MKKILTTAACLMLLLGCKETTTQVPALADNTDAVIKGTVSLDELGAKIDDEYAPLYGIWEGNAGNDEDPAMLPVIVKIKGVEEGRVNAKITIGDKVFYIHGKHEIKEDKFFVRFKQGSNKYEKNILELWHDGDKLTGTYTTKLGEPAIKTELAHRSFAYDPNVMPDIKQAVDWETSKPIKRKYTDEDGHAASYDAEGHRYTSKDGMELNASVEKLTEGQLKNLRKLDLEMIRNTIYARHGYAFKRSYLRNFFNSADWYVPVSDNVEKDLTKLEQQNIALLKRMEKYATDHYEYFGR